METSHPDDDPLGGEAEEGQLHLGVVGAEHDGLQRDNKLEIPLIRVWPTFLPHVVQGCLGEVQSTNGHSHWLTIKKVNWWLITFVECIFQQMPTGGRCVRLQTSRLYRFRKNFLKASSVLILVHKSSQTKI